MPQPVPTGFGGARLACSRPPMRAFRGTCTCFLSACRCASARRARARTRAALSRHVPRATARQLLRLAARASVCRGCVHRGLVSLQPWRPRPKRGPLRRHRLRRHRSQMLW